MYPNQFGFIPNSCATFALISMQHHWLGATNGTGAYVRAALLDYKKAFDLVDHNLLIAKLYSLGVKSTVVNWVIDFLLVSSLALIVLRALPQSPLEFYKVPASALSSFWAWLMTSLPRANPLSGMWKFANDTTVSEIVPKSGATKIKDTVDYVLQWSNDNKFKLHSLKCKELRIDFRTKPNEVAYNWGQCQCLWNHYTITITKVSCCRGNISESHSYWFKAREDLKAIISHVGPPTLFYIFISWYALAWITCTLWWWK